MNDYPTGIVELDLDSMEFPPAALEAMRRLARSRPWRGTTAERKLKLLPLNADLAAAYGVTEPRVAKPEGSVTQAASLATHAVHQVVVKFQPAAPQI